MKAVLDESVPKRLARTLRDRGHDVQTFPAGWKGLKNGRLLDEAEMAGFQCLLTSDKNLRHQQAIPGRSLAVIVMPAQRFADLLPFLDQIDSALLAAAPGRTIVIARSPRPNL